MSGVKGKSGVYFRTKQNRINLGKAHRGKIGWNRGLKTGIIPKTAFKKGQQSIFKGKRRPEISGENHYMWRGGISKLAERIRKCFKYRQWRSDVFTRDNYTCQDCGERGYIIHAHHIKSFSDILRDNKIKIMEQALNCEELWNINNGITLCKKCHHKQK